MTPEAFNPQARWALLGAFLKPPSGPGGGDPSNSFGLSRTDTWNAIITCYRFWQWTDQTWIADQNPTDVNGAFHNLMGAGTPDQWQRALNVVRTIINAFFGCIHDGCVNTIPSRFFPRSYNNRATVIVSQNRSSTTTNLC